MSSQLDPRQVQNFAITVRTVKRSIADPTPVVSADHLVDYTPVTWRAAANDLAARVLAEGRCLITRRPIPPGRDQSREHVILQGLGARWIDLAAGVVDDGLNNALSASELKFLRSGLMGTLRSWYLGEKYEQVFRRVGGGTIVYRHDPSKGYVIELHGGEFRPVVETSGAGSFTFEVEEDATDPLAVSRSLQKIAYLALAVRAPDLALSPLFDEARVFIESPTQDTFRPYSERFLPGAAPGFDLAVQVEGTAVDDNDVAPHRVLVSLRLHHVHYAFSTAGEALLPPVGDDEFVVYRHATPTQARRRSMTWAFGRIEQRAHP